MSALHTPGPWSFHLVKVQRDITGPHGQNIAYTRGGWITKAEDHANARLIATAPELLALAETIVRMADGRVASGHLILDENSPVIVAAMALIDKATGAAPPATSRCPHCGDWLGEHDRDCIKFGRGAA